MSFVDLWYYPALVLVFIVVVFIQFLFWNKFRLSNTLSKATLLIFSYILMILYDFRFAVCLTCIIMFVYISGMQIEKITGKAQKLLTCFTVIILVATLGVFKYLNFFMSSAYGLIGKSWTPLNLILPTGISFYIFSCIGYILDVSWGRIESEHNIIDIALFISFFPKQVCGPIVNARDFLPQLKENRRISFAGIERGIQIFIFGFFKKFALANNIGVFVDSVFKAPIAYSTPTIWLAVLSYFLQLYFDFSGYTDMAIGVSNLFGYDIGRNFNFPFLSRNIDDYWDRWHISLTSWLNEYVFNLIAIKLKRTISRWPKERKKRCKNLPTYTALMLTFLISGLWHGAGFTFIVWGLMHGVLSVCHRFYVNLVRRSGLIFISKSNSFFVIIDTVLNFVTLMIIQIFFRADSLNKAFDMLRLMFCYNVGIKQISTWTFLGIIILIVAAILAVVRSKKLKLSTVDGYYPIMDLSTIKGMTIFLLACGFSIIFANFGESYFIYANF